MNESISVRRGEACTPPGAVRIGFLLLCLFVIFVLSRSAVAQNVNLPPVTRATLPNGIRVVLMEYRRAPSFTALALFPGGTSVDPAGKAGVASLTADLLRKGTEKRTATQIAEEVDFLGATLGAAAGDDLLTVSLSALSRDSGAALDLFADAIRHSTFLAEELERERQLTLAALESIGEDPGAVASRVATETVFAGHPYGMEPTISSVKTITRDDLQAYYRRFISPNRMILVAVGDFRSPDMLAKLRERFADWQKAEETTIAVPKVPVSSVKTVVIDKADATQTQARFIRMALPRVSPDYFNAEVADTILGGGFTSRLVEEIRINRKLTYGISSSFGMHRQGGSFQVSSFTRIETTRKLIDSVREALQKAATSGFTEAERNKAIRYTSGLFAIRVQTPEALAGELAEIAFYGLPDNYLQTYLSRVRAVTLADINRIARTYYPPGRLALVLVAPAKAVAAQLKGLGPMETRPVASVAK